MTEKKWAVPLTKENKELVITYVKNAEIKHKIERLDHMENHESVSKMQLVVFSEKDHEQVFKYCNTLRKFNAQDEMNFNKKRK